MEKAIKEYYEALMTPRVARFANLLWWDLYYGPLNGCDHCGADACSECKCEHPWPGFNKAIEIVGAWVDSNVEPMVYDHQSGEVHPGNEASLYDDFEHGDVYQEHLYLADTKEVKVAIFGREVSQYV